MNCHEVAAQFRVSSGRDGADERQHVTRTSPRRASVLARRQSPPLPAARLLRCAEAALKAVDELEHIDTAPPSGKEDEAAALGLRWCAAKVRAAIVCGLTGKEAGDGG